MKYIDLIVDNRSDSTDNPYTYGCEDDSVSVGSRVLVPFANGNRLRKAGNSPGALLTGEDGKRSRFIQSFVIYCFQIAGRQSGIILMRLRLKRRTR